MYYLAKVYLSQFTNHLRTLRRKWAVDTYNLLFRRWQEEFDTLQLPSIIWNSFFELDNSY